MSEKVVRYKCGYCEKLFKTEKGVDNHESHKCWHRESSQTCFTCGLFVDKEVVTNFTVKGGTMFELDPKCAEEYDMYYEAWDGTHRTDKPHRQFECGLWEPREDHPGEYVKFKTGLGGYRKVYLKHEAHK